MDKHGRYTRVAIEDRNIETKKLPFGSFFVSCTSIYVKED
jgi:hypothetical protein